MGPGQTAEYRRIALPALPVGKVRANSQHREENDMTVLKSMTMGVLVLATAGCASAPPLQSPTVNVTGDWVGTWTCDFTREGNGTMGLGLHQSGRRGQGPRPGANRAFTQR